MGVWYCTREDVKSALDFKETARSDAQVDRAIESASRSVEGLLRRRFYPWTGTRYFDWPNQQYARSYRLWLESNELVSAATLTTGGRTVDASDYVLRRSDGLDEAPYDQVELLLNTNATFGGGSTHQRDIAITGVFAGCAIDEAASGTLAEDLDTSETSVDVTDSSLIGVGSILRVGSERMFVTGRSMADTGVDIDAGDSLTASNNDTSITVSSTSGAPQVGEVILIDAERMLVVDTAGATLVVRRAWDGSVLAAHSPGASIYALRTLIVTRGALGTTAASHLTGASVLRFLVPGTVRALCVAEAVSVVLNEGSGYARVAGSGENAREAAGRSLNDLRQQARIAYGRIGRIGAV